uniref:HTH luxR-type domain-containing protein n=1 Tax=Enterobacter asburiae TaxID=61645 RepID=A0A217EU16_ENTAS|nr:hypothetical protein [Enterobacter asburiae]AQZ19795.1 hypothetical protein [Enterobacter asburiae]
MKILHPSMLKKIKIKIKKFSFECLSQKQTEFLNLTLRGATDRTISKVINIPLKTESAYRCNVQIKMEL